MTKNNNFNHLFIDQLRDIFSAENQLVKALPKVVKAAENPELKKAIQTHLGETENQVKRLIKIFKILNENPEGNTCEAMEGLIKECDDAIKDYSSSSVRDAAIISAAQRVEHYEISAYGTLKTFAKLLDFDEFAELLDETLNEESNADKKLGEIAEGGFFTTGVNVKAIGK